MNVSTSAQAIYSVLPAIVPEVRVYFDIAMMLFIAAFFFGLHWRMHVQQHLCPPFYAMWLLDRFRRLRCR